jgi:hypothetical protein
MAEYFSRIMKKLKELDYDQRKSQQEEAALLGRCSHVDTEGFD